METISLSEYQARLIAHDWSYDYSDDNRVWKRGREEHQKLQEYAKLSEAHMDLYKVYYQEYLSQML